MRFRLLTVFEQFLAWELPHILSIPYDVPFFELSDTPEDEVSKYMYFISGKDIGQIYQNLFIFLRGLDFELTPISIECIVSI